MSKAAILRFPTSDPDDMSALSAAISAGRLDPMSIASVWMKTAGNGLRNDHSRALADLAFRTAVAAASGETLAAIRDRILILASGGSEGVVSPHMVVVSARPLGGDRIGLALGVSGGAILPGQIGSAAHVDATAGQVTRALNQAGIAPGSCGLVLIRAPTDPTRPGQDGAARSAAALGAALALHENGPGAAARLADPAAHATNCFVVARHDNAPQQVLVLGQAPGGDPGFAIASGCLHDPIDSPGVAAILARLGLQAAPQLSAADSARVVAVISKGDGPPDGMIRGLPHVMYADNDIAMHRHARAAYGTLLSAAIGHTACLVSGGAERQGPPGGGFAAIIIETGQN